METYFTSLQVRNGLYFGGLLGESANFEYSTCRAGLSNLNQLRAAYPSAGS